MVPLSGGAVGRAPAAETFTLAGRPDVFAGPTDFVYLPRGHHRHADLRRRRPLRPVRRAERRRAAGCTTAPSPRSRSSCAGPGSPAGRSATSAPRRRWPPGAIIACEVITPGGNWSSYPAHKHDEATETESELEEIYYFEIAAGPNGEPGLGFMRTSSSPGHDIDLCEEVHDRDAVLVPYGWHGPVRRRARARHVLPERDGRTAEPERWRAGLEDLRPPRPDLGPRHLGRPAGRPATDDDVSRGLLIMAETVRLTVAQAT